MNVNIRKGGSIGLVLVVVLSVVANPVMAASFIAVTDVEGDDGEQTWETDLEADGETSPGDVIRIVTFDDSGDEIDYSTAEVTTNMDDTNLTHFSEGESDLFVEYTVQEGDIGDTLTVTVSGIDVNEDGYENYTVVHEMGEDEEEDLASGSFDYFATTADDADGDDDSTDDSDEVVNVDYRFGVVEGDEALDEFEFVLEDADETEVHSEDVTEGGEVDVTDLEDGEEYTYTVTYDVVTEDDEGNETTETEEYVGTVTADADADTDDDGFVVYEIDIGSDGLFGGVGGDVSDGLSDLWSTIEDNAGSIAFIIVIGGVVIVVLKESDEFKR